MKLNIIRRATKFPFALLVVGVLGSCSLAHADAQAQLIRSLAAKYKPSVVTLSLVVKLAAGGFEDQSEMEAAGVLLDASGLVVTTNNAVDPMSAYDSEDGTAGISSRVTSVKILTTFGAEIPAKVVLRDKDLNLAFVRPLKTPSVKLQGVSFQSGATAQLGDPLLLMGRLGKTGNRTLRVKTERVTSVLDKPRRFYVLDAYSAIYVGNVVFNESGQPLGLLTTRVPVGKARLSDTSLPVVIPGRDILEIARQAPQAKDVKDATVKTTPTTPTKPAPKKS